MYRALSCCVFLLLFGINVSVAVVVVVALDHHQLAANQKLHLQLAAIFFSASASGDLFYPASVGKGAGDRLITDTNAG